MSFAINIVEKVVSVRYLLVKLIKVINVANQRTDMVVVFNNDIEYLAI